VHRHDRSKPYRRRGPAGGRASTHEARGMRIADLENRAPGPRSRRAYGRPASATSHAGHEQHHEQAHAGKPLRPKPTCVAASMAQGPEPRRKAERIGDGATAVADDWRGERAGEDSGAGDSGGPHWPARPAHGTGPPTRTAEVEPAPGTPTATSAPDRSAQAQVRAQPYAGPPRLFPARGNGGRVPGRSKHPGGERQGQGRGPARG